MKRRKSLPESIALEKKPPGWIIRVDSFKDGLILQWSMNGSLHQRIGLIAARILVPIWLCVWIAIGATAQFSAIAQHAGVLQIACWFVLWLLALIWTLLICMALFKPSRAEAIWLADDWFGYDPGAQCPPMLVWDLSLLKHWRHLWLTSKRTVKARNELSEFELVRTGDCQRLSFQHDLETVEVGHCLCDSERRWLFTLLEQWRTGHDVARLDQLLLESPRVDGAASTAIVANREDLAAKRNQ